jgi:hypothetical protein
MALRIRSVSKKELNCGKRIIPSRNYEKGAIPQVSRDQPIELGIIRYSLQRPIALSPTWRIGPTVQLFSRRNGLIF